MSDWEKLKRIARLQKALAELSDEIIEAQTTLRDQRNVKDAVQDVKEAYVEVQDVWRF